MPATPETAPNRTARRKARTRAALVRAAQGFIAEGRPHAPILEITQAADVGMGSFYNHFESREELMRVASEEAFEAHGRLLDELTLGIDDPAEIFAQNFRLTGRIHRREPELSRVLLDYGLQLIDIEIGLAPRALRAIKAGADAGRFTVADPELSLTIVAGATLVLGNLLHEHPERDDAEATDQVAEDLLRMLGMAPEEAYELAHRPLPELTTIAWQEADL
ncbi:TetR/AcrR family transcriptional regulator [Nocardiopsis alba]|uniref:TetR/AcrR family transcriptional regulator n=1 Tax=Nocardiopsis alba TaxID=53437 RepID=UPI00380BDA68